MHVQSRRTGRVAALVAALLLAVGAVAGCGTGDDAVAQGNTFQAKATLESIVDNYEGDKAVLDEAKTKLETIKSEELKQSKIMQILPTDTLIMEQDSILKN